MTNANPAPKKGVIFGTVATLVVAAAGLVGGVAYSDGGFNDTSTPVVVSVLGLIASILPSVLAYLKIDQVKQNIENGVLVEKVKQGTAEAIEEAQVITRTGPVVSAELQALNMLLQRVGMPPVENPAQEAARHDREGE